MKKEWLLAIAATLVTSVIVLGLIRWLAPGLLGVPRGLELVNVSKELPPFYAGVFRDDDFTATDFILPDPIFVNRAKPLIDDQFAAGPHDILGFRNRGVPDVADIITIGDSQTYGNNVPMEYNWPSRLRSYISAANSAVVYNMSCGGWDGIQYFEIAKDALRFRPRVVTVAFYTGNDPVGAFVDVYGAPQWSAFRLDAHLTKADAPNVPYPPPPTDFWPANFKDGTSTIFTPKLRLASNLRDNAAVRTGWAILGEVARRINDLAQGSGVPAVFTIIPTKELVYAPRIADEGLSAPEAFRTLAGAEPQYIAELSAAIRQLPGATYVDVVAPLQEAARTKMLYLPNENGHPRASGYDVIAHTLAPVIEAHLAKLPQGLVFIDYAPEMSVPVLARGDSFLVFASNELIAANGWGEAPKLHVPARDVAAMRNAGMISTAEPDKFGPQASETASSGPG